MRLVEAPAATVIGYVGDVAEHDDQLASGAVGEDSSMRLPD